MVPITGRTKIRPESLVHPLPESLRFGHLESSGNGADDLTAEARAPELVLVSLFALWVAEVVVLEGAPGMLALVEGANNVGPRDNVVFEECETLAKLPDGP